MLAPEVQPVSSQITIWHQTWMHCHISAVLGAHAQGPAALHVLQQGTWHCQRILTRMNRVCLVYCAVH